jgi:hypothetical protein
MIDAPDTMEQTARSTSDKPFAKEVKISASKKSAHDTFLTGVITLHRVDVKNFLTSLNRMGKGSSSVISAQTYSTGGTKPAIDKLPATQLERNMYPDVSTPQVKMFAICIRREIFLNELNFENSCRSIRLTRPPHL